jgi:hypothetical protein
MNTFAIEDIKNINVNCIKSVQDRRNSISIGSATDIDFESRQGSTTRIELSTENARYLAEELHKAVFDKSEQPETLWERIRELEAVNLVLEDKLKEKGGSQVNGKGE